MSQLKVLKVEFDNMGFKGVIYPVVLFDNKDMILVDCGYPHFLPMIENCARENGIDLSRLTKLIITHHDHDHMGSAADFKRKYPDMQIISSSIEEKYINGSYKSLRLIQTEELFKNLPEDQKANSLNFQNKIKSVENVDVDMVVDDGDVFDWCGGIEIVGTPGHMPGHISIYANESRTLIAGDALMVEGNVLKGPNPRFTLDMKKARESIHKLLNYDIDVIVSYHGGVFRGDVKEALRRI